MKLELKNIKVVQSLSEETYCYTAKLYVDGKKVADVSNRGHGGCDEVRCDQATIDRINAYLATLPEVPMFDGKTIKQDLELWCGEQLDAYMTAKDLRKELKGKVLFIEEGKPGIQALRWKGVRTVEDRHIAAAQKSYPTAKILNTLPFDEAIVLYKTAA